MRSGYTDDIDGPDPAMWRGRVASAMRGKRGQALLRESLAALDAMPEKRLIREELVNDAGDVCLLGAVGRKLDVKDIAQIDPEDHDKLAERFNVSACLIQEIEYVNDEQGYNETPERRFERVRKWLVEHVRVAAAPNAADAE